MCLRLYVVCSESHTDICVQLATYCEEWSICLNTFNIRHCERTNRTVVYCISPTNINVTSFQAKIFFSLSWENTCFLALHCKWWFVTVETTRDTEKSLQLGSASHKYEGWNFNSGNYLFTTDTK